MRHPQVRRTLARTAQHDQLLLEQEILSDDGSHAAGSAELRGCDGQVKQGEQEILHARDGIVKLSRIRLTDPQDDGLKSRREPGMLGVDHRDSA